jgi:hypothetical protein
MAFYISGLQLLFETTEIKVHNRSVLSIELFVGDAYFLNFERFEKMLFLINSCNKRGKNSNKNIDGFYTKTTQKGGFSKLCVKIKIRCKHNLVSFFGRIVF